jgi:ribosome-associated toxin RatA of RatAB toxin-antitoxin module
VQSQLAAGQVVSRSELDAGQSRARIDAAIRINASMQTVWKLLTECKYASIYIPGLRHCKVVDSAPDGSWAVVEHDIKYSALLPLVHSVFRADYRPPQQIEFHRVSGDFKSESGQWLLQSCADRCVTVEYRVSIQPGFWAPHSMVQRSLKRQLPSALLALRARAARMEDAASADAAVPAAQTNSAD